MLFETPAERALRIAEEEARKQTASLKRQEELQVGRNIELQGIAERQKKAERREAAHQRQMESNAAARLAAERERLAIEKERQRRAQVASPAMVRQHWPRALGPGEVVTVGQIEDWLEHQRQIAREEHEAAERVRRAAPADERLRLRAGSGETVGECEDAIRRRRDREFELKRRLTEIEEKRKQETTVVELDESMRLAFVLAPVTYLLVGWIGFQTVLLLVLLLCFSPGVARLVGRPDPRPYDYLSFSRQPSVYGIAFGAAAAFGFLLWLVPWTMLDDLLLLTAMVALGAMMWLLRSADPTQKLRTEEQTIRAEFAQFEEIDRRVVEWVQSRRAVDAT